VQSETCSRARVRLARLIRCDRDPAVRTSGAQGARLHIGARITAGQVLD
jgi:hypothetical protein